LTIGRYQPLHKGHLSVFRQIDDECDSLIIGVGSAQKERENKNPLSGGERITMIRRVLEDRDIGPYEIYPIPDINCYPAWPFYVKAIIPHFDYLYVHSKTVLRLFEGTGTRLRRVDEFNKDKWSATKIRTRISKGEEWEHLVPEEVAEYLKEIDMRERLKPKIDMETETEREAAHLLTKDGKTIATAESCTGGLLAHRLTNTPGSTKYFERGFVVYSPEAKVDLIGVEEDILDECGSVSSETARKMAEKVREKGGADIGLATTGVLGPGGDGLGTPIGTVYVGISDGKDTEVNEFRFSGNRWEVKEQATEEALRCVVDLLDGK